MKLTTLLTNILNEITQSKTITLTIGELVSKTINELNTLETPINYKKRNHPTNPQYTLHDKIEREYLPLALEKTLTDYVTLNKLNEYQIENTKIHLIREQTLIKLKPWIKKEASPPVPDYVMLIDTPKKAALYAIEIKSIYPSKIILNKSLKQCFSGLKLIKNNLNQIFPTTKKKSTQNYAILLCNKKVQKLNFHLYKHSIHMRRYKLKQFKNNNTLPSFQYQTGTFLGTLYHHRDPNKPPKIKKTNTKKPKKTKKQLKITIQYYKQTS